MTTAAIVDLEKVDGEQKFFLPPKRRALLGNDGGGMAVFSWVVPMLCQIHGELTECFKKDGPSGMY